mmetsp:Transcript_25653/g.71769  ORF Transcript_25653/g.71769 Transcript_25653/m.71769 type:complete len:346 (+) Transcript_25653:335-1372(+)
MDHVHGDVDAIRGVTKTGGYGFPVRTAHIKVDCAAALGTKENAAGAMKVLPMRPGCAAPQAPQPSSSRAPQHRVQSSTGTAVAAAHLALAERERNAAVRSNQPRGSAWTKPASSQQAHKPADEAGSEQTDHAMQTVQRMIADILSSGEKAMPKCPASTELLAQVEGLRSVARSCVSIGITGPDAETGAAEILSKTISLPEGIQTKQSELVDSVPKQCDVTVILVDASIPSAAATARQGGGIAFQNQAGTCGRNLKTLTTEGPVGELLQRAIGKVGHHNVFIGIAGCGAEAAGLPSDCASTEAGVASHTCLKAHQVVAHQAVWHPPCSIWSAFGLACSSLACWLQW